MNGQPEDISLIRHMLGEAGAAEQQRVAGVLESDEDLRQHYAALREKWWQSGLIPDVESMDIDRQWELFMEKRNAAAPAPGMASRRRLPIIKLAAAAACIALLLAFLYHYRQRPAAPQLVRLSIPAGRQGHCTLPDGTQVWLNAGSTLVYPQTFGGQREVSLQGEAYFEVEGNAARPFYVHTGGVDVVVLGTRFNVMAYENDSLVSTSLLQGNVQVSSPAGGATTLQPGERATWRRGQPGFSKMKMDTETDIRWKEGELVFRNEPLNRAFARLERWFDVKIAYDTLRLGSRQITARLEKGETLERTLQLLQEVLPVRCALRNREVQISYSRHKPE